MRTTLFLTAERVALAFSCEPPPWQTHEERAHDGRMARIANRTVIESADDKIEPALIWRDSAFNRGSAADLLL